MNPRAAVIIVAAGSGSRMQAAVPKQYLVLAGTPIIIRSIEPFTRCPFIHQLVVVVPADRTDETRNLLATHGLGETAATVVAGGRRRQDSVQAGLAQIAGDIEIVLVHDGARPFVSPELITRCYQAIVDSGAALAAVPVKDTIKRSDPDHWVNTTIDRTLLWRAQTPQGGRTELLHAAFAMVGKHDVTDEAALFELAGIPVRLVAGDEANDKITNPEDFQLAQQMANHVISPLRIGHGFDAHRFSEGRPLVLGGVTVDYHLGLAGHSDADVLTHALCDALLGAIGAGDIGRHFPDNDPAFKGIRSLLLLDRVIELVAARNLTVVNADLTIVCQEPKLSPYIDAMREALSARCLTPRERFNIKATTTERMGYTGRGEGICCHAVVLVQELTP